MATPYTPAVQALIDEFGRLPGIGPRTAQRIALHLIKADEEDVSRLARVIIDARHRVRFCERCFNLSDDQFCTICNDAKRDTTKICLVEDARDLAAIERTGEFRGRYHVLLGLINPLQGIEVKDLKLRELVARIQSEHVEEVIVCTSSTVEGDVTASYVSKLLSPLGVSVTRIASGLPVGSDLEFADELTLGRALGNRTPIDND